MPRSIDSRPPGFYVGERVRTIGTVGRFGKITHSDAARISIRWIDGEITHISPMDLDGTLENLDAGPRIRHGVDLIWRAAAARSR